MFFKKLFGKKNDGFYLQLEDEDNPSTAAKAKSQPPASTDKAPAAVTPAAPAAAPIDKSEVAPAATLDAKAVAKAEKEAEKVAKKAAKKAESAMKSEATKQAEELKATVAVEPAITNFATDYLIKPSSASSRRRPGANMSAFMEMSRQAKKPEAFKK